MLVNLSIIGTRLADRIITTFFPQSPAGMAIGEVGRSLVFASFPLAVGIAILLVPPVQSRLGVYGTTAAGLVISIAASCVTSVQGDPSLHRGFLAAAPLVACRMAGGFGMALSDAGIFALVSLHFDKWRARVYAGVDVMCGVACTLAPYMGGVLYDLGGRPWESFLLPVLSSCAFLVPSLLLLLLVYSSRPARSPATESKSGAEEQSQRRAWAELLALLCTPQVLISLVATSIAALINEIFAPIIEPILRGAPFNLPTEADVGAIFAIYGGFYLLTALPCGAFIDWLRAASSCSKQVIFRLRRVMMSGGLVTAAAFALTGPAALAAGGHATKTEGIGQALYN